MHSLPESSDKLKQLKLPFESVPEKVKSHGLRDAHSSPLVSRGKDRDGKLSSFRVSPKEAGHACPLILRENRVLPLPRTKGDELA